MPSGNGKDQPSPSPSPPAAAYSSSPSLKKSPNSRYVGRKQEAEEESIGLAQSNLSWGGIASINARGSVSPLTPQPDMVHLQYNDDGDAIPVVDRTLLQQPKLTISMDDIDATEAVTSATPTPTAANTSNCLHNKHGRKGISNNDTGNRITLTDITSNPLEDEAENAIIRALEAREWENRQDEQQFNANSNFTAANAMEVDSAKRIGLLGGISDATLKIVLEEDGDIDEAAAVRTGLSFSSKAKVSPPSSPRRASPSKSDAASIASRSSVGSRSNKIRRSPPKLSGGGRKKFQDIAEQLKNAQAFATPSRRAVVGAGEGGRDGAAANDNAPGGYLLKAAAAFQNAQSSRGLATSNSTDSTGRQLLSSSKSRRALARLSTCTTNEDDDDDSDVELCAADNMVKNMNMMLGLPNKNKDEEDYVRRKDGAFDLEAQQPQPPSPVPQVKKTATQNWGKVRLAVNTSAAMADTAAAVAAAKDATTADEGVGCPTMDNSSIRRKQEPSFCDRLPFVASYRHFLRRSQEILEDVSSSINMKQMIKVLVGFFIMPSMFVSAILFYAAGNPMPGNPGDLANASYSWWILFVGARQICTLALSRFTEILIVDILTLRTRTFLRLVGPFVSLLIIQARGWPYVLTFWSVWDFAFLHGTHSFAKHWLFYIPLGWFGECRYDIKNPANNIEYPQCNPAGSVVYSDIYFRVLIAMIVFGTLTSLKRAGLALYQGKKSTGHYGPQLEALMKRMLLISEIAYLADEIEFTYSEEGQHYSVHGNATAKAGGLDFSRLRATRREDNSDVDEDEDEESLELSKASPPPSPSRSTSSKTAKSSPPPSAVRNTPADQFAASGSLLHLRTNTEDLASVPTNLSAEDEASTAIDLALSEIAKVKLMELVGEWEEPLVMVGNRSKSVSLQDILQFRQACLCLDSKYPFSYAFGRANTREICIDSAQVVYNQLLMHTPSEVILPFDTLALIALDNYGGIDEKKARKLIRQFRPARDGTLTCLDFVKSCDRVYKDLRTLRAAIANSSQLDLALERLVNVVFFFVLTLIVLTIIKLDPWTLFLSLSGFILSFAFMFGRAASSVFEGILLILVQKPYDIGDKIHISNANVDTSSSGSPTWFVEAINLYSTTVRRGATNEVATHSNGSLASSRIINANRSPKAVVYIYLKFASDVPYDRVMLFKTVIEVFVKDRPREWISMSGFRATRVEADLGYIEYVMVLQHVDKWQNIGPIKQSQADVASYCLEVQKKLGMRYAAPPMPVKLGIANTIVTADYDTATPESSSSPDFSFLASLFANAQNDTAKKTK